jgi:hypothetical protein
LGQKGFEMGTMAAQMCIKEIEDNNNKFKPRTETLSNELIIRKSSQRIELGKKNKVDPNQYLGQKAIDDSLIYIY